MIEALAEDFVVECEEISLERRGELGLGACEAVDPRRLARDVFGVDVLGVDHYRLSDRSAVAQLTERDAASFSAVTVFHGTRALIVVNPSQGAVEEALAVAHEISHIELGHAPLRAPLFDEEGRRLDWDPVSERQADHLAGAILVPRSGLEKVLSRVGGRRSVAAERFGVSPALIRRRLIETGIELADTPGIDVPEGAILRLEAKRELARDIPTSGHPPG